MASTAYILDTRSTINPARPHENQYFGGDQWEVYVVRKEGSSRLKVFTSYGPISGWVVGGRAPVIADQSRRNLGYHEIVGVRHGNGLEEGFVPDKPLRHGVFK